MYNLYIIHMIPKQLGTPFILLLCFIPFALWFPEASFATSPNIVYSLGQITGLIGAVLLSLNFILAARLKFLDPLFNGLNRIYIVHHLTGAISFILLLFHPVLLALWYLPTSTILAAKLLIPDTGNLPVWFGIMSLLVLIVLLVITFFIPVAYQLWKSTHQYLGISLLFATLHIFFIPSTVTYNLPLRYYMLTLCLLGIIAYFYRTVLGRKLVPRLAYKIDHVGSLSPDILEISLVPESKPIKHLPGQFLFMSVTNLGISGETHPFSIASAPGSQKLGLAVKSSGDYTETLRLLKPGAMAKIEGPFGRFTYENSYHQKQVWIAGGIGVTPFLSMARSLSLSSPYRATLFYVVSTPDEAVYVNELQTIAKNLPDNFQFILHSSKTSGRLNSQTVQNLLPDFMERDIFICGPLPMMSSLRKQFTNLKIKNRFIHSEEFSLN